MYGSTGAAGGIAGGTLAATGANPWFALAVGVITTTVGLALVARRWMLARRETGPVAGRI